MFAASGDLYFTSARPDPETPEADPVNALWMLPADGGEARVVLTRAGGVSGLLAAKDAGALFVNASVLAGSTDEDSDEERRKARKDNKVAAILHSGYPVRYWDADLGPAQPRLFAVEPGEEQEPGKPATVDAARAAEAPQPDARRRERGSATPSPSSARTAKRSTAASPSRSPARIHAPSWSRSTSPPAPARSCWTPRA